LFNLSIVVGVIAFFFLFARDLQSRKTVLDLRDKYVVITGASSGIGEAIALRMAKDGANLLIVARRAADLARVRSECLKAGAPKVEVVVGDMSDKKGASVRAVMLSLPFLTFVRF
jgi:NADP-dependent 3-hydroxy acid dehydrogenase YdfG